MATSYGTSIPTLVVYRVHRVGAIAWVRVHIGEMPAGDCVGELMLRPSEFRLWRATVLHVPARCSIWYGDGVFEWLNSVAPLAPEAVA